MKTITSSLFLVLALTLFSCSESVHILKNDSGSGNVSGAAGLSNLQLSSGTLSPSFSSSTLNYTATVTETYIEVIPTATNPSSEIKVNNEIVASGHSSSAITLAIGSNPINITITDADGAQQQYIVAIERTQVEAVRTLLSNNAYLSSITISEGTLTPHFSSTKYYYSASVANDVNSLTIYATTDTTSSILSLEINGEAVAGVQSGSNTEMSLSVGDNVAHFLVQAPDESTRSYVVVIHRSSVVSVVSSNDNLLSAEIGGASLTTSFDAGQTFYTTQELSSSVQQTTVTAIPVEQDATISMTKTTVVNGQEITTEVPVENNTATIELTTETTFVTITVTAPNKTSVKSYTVSIFRAAPVAIELSGDADLSALSLSEASISQIAQNFPSDYAATVDYSVTAVTVNATSSDPDADITVEFPAAEFSQSAQSSIASDPISISVGVNSINIKVTAVNGNKKTYTISVNRQAEVIIPDPIVVPTTSFAVTLSDGTPLVADPAIANTFTASTVSTSLTIIATPDDPAVATCVISPSDFINIDINSTKLVNVKCSAQTGEYSEQFILISQITFIPRDNSASLIFFAPTQISETAIVDNMYYVTIDASSTSIDIVPLTTDPLAVVVAATTAAPTAAPLYSIYNSSLDTYYNGLTVNVEAGTVATAEVDVTAQNGEVKSYFINITRPATVVPVVTPDVRLASLAIAEATLDQTFDVDSATVNYTASVANEVTSANITAAPVDPDSILSISQPPAEAQVVAANTPFAVTLSEGANVFNIIVSKDDVQSLHTLTITRAHVTPDPILSNDSSFVATLSDGTPIVQDPSDPLKFTASTTSTSISITATPTDPAATCVINGVSVAYGVASEAMNLSISSVTPATIICTAQDGKAHSEQFISITQTATIPSDNSLSSLRFFAPTELSPSSVVGKIYSVTIDAAATFADIVPIANDQLAVVTINGSALYAIYNSALDTYYNGATISVEAGATAAAEIDVTAQNSITERYFVIINRPAPVVVTDLRLASLSIAEANLDQTFDPDSATINYTASVANEVTSANITAAPVDLNAALSIGQPPAEAQAATANSPFTVTLSEGANVFNIIVTNNNIQSLHTLTINRAYATLPPELSHDASFVATLSDGTTIVQDLADPLKFTASTISTNLTITAIPTDLAATCVINGVSVAYGVASEVMNLTIGGVTPATVICTAQDGTTHSEQFISITQIPTGPSEAGFEATISAGELVYDSEISYRAEVSSETTTVTVTMQDPLATATVNGESLVSGGTSSPIHLSTGNNTITIIGLAEDGYTSITKFLLIHRTAAENDASLLSLVISDSTFTDPIRFSSSSFAYNATVTKGTVTVTPTATAHEDATITVNGVSVVSGEHTNVTVDQGDPNIIVRVTSKDGSATNTYTVITTTASTYYCESTPEKGYQLCDPYNNIQLGTDANHYFKLTTPDGNPLYVKQTIQLKMDQTGVLVDKYFGYPLEPQVTLPYNMTKLNITPSGVIEINTEGSTNVSIYGQIATATFPNIEALQLVADAYGVEALQQAGTAMLSSLSSGSRINSASDTVDTGEGSYYSETADSGSVINDLPTGSLFGNAITYCGKLSVPELGSVKLRTQIVGNGFIELQQPNGEAAYYASNFSTRTIYAQQLSSIGSAQSTELYVDTTKTNEINIVNDTQGRLIEATTGLPITPSITVPSDVLIDTLAINEVGVVTVTSSNDGSTLSLGQINLFAFANPTGLTPSTLNPNVFLPSQNSGTASYSTPGSNGLGLLNQYSRCVYAPTIIPAMEAHEATYSYQSSVSNICVDGKMTIEITDLAHYLQFTDPNTSAIYYKTGQQEIMVDPSTGLLVDSRGYVLGYGIAVPADATQIIVLPNGTVQAYTPSSAQPAQIGTIQIFSSISGFEPAPEMEGYYVPTAQTIALAPTGGFFGPSIAYCGSRILADQSNNLLSDRMTINMEIQGACFFGLLDSTGMNVYTKNNKFIVDQYGVIREQSSGLKLQPEITVPANSISVYVSSDGIVSATLDDASTVQIGQIPLYKFQSVGGLSKSVENYLILMESSQNSGQYNQVPAGQYGCGVISFGSYGSRSDFSDVTNLLFTSEKDALQKLDDTLALFDPLNPANQIAHPVCTNYSLALSSFVSTCQNSSTLVELLLCERTFRNDLAAQCGEDSVAYVQLLSASQEQPSCFDPRIVEASMGAECTDNNCVDSMLTNLSLTCGDISVVPTMIYNQINNSSLCFYPETAQAAMDAECGGDYNCSSNFIQTVFDQCGTENFVGIILQNSIML